MKKHIANIITGSRAIFSLPLLFIPLSSSWFCALYLLCGFTDMIDGAIARKTGSTSAFGEKLDTVSDFVFMAAVLVRFVPFLHISVWLWIWIVVIAVIKVGNIVCGFVRTRKFISRHTVLNKITGLFLFVLPLTLFFIEVIYTLPIVCAMATIAAIHEVYSICSEKKYDT